MGKKKRERPLYRGISPLGKSARKQREEDMKAFGPAVLEYLRRERKKKKGEKG